MRYLIGCGVTAAIAALILSCSGANWLSTIMTASSPAATVMLPPKPSSMYVRLPRSVVFIVTFEKSGPTGGVCASAGATSQTIAASALRLLTLGVVFFDDAILQRFFMIPPSKRKPAEKTTPRVEFLFH